MSTTTAPRTVTIDSYAAAQHCYRNRNLRQGSYDEGDVVMADVVINLHGADRPRTDRLFCQRATHETIRLQPSSPVAVRWAEADITLPDGTTLEPGDKVVIDLPKVNRDPAVFGDNADEPPEMDPSTTRPYFGRYPVIFTRTP